MFGSANRSHAHRRTTTGSAKRRFAGIAGGGAGLAALVAVLVLAAPLTSAHGTVTFTAPYSGFTSSTYNFVNGTGCSHASNPTAAVWTSSSGTFQFAATSAGLCARGGDSYGEGFITIDSPLFSAPANGAGSVFVTLSSAFTAKAAFHAGTSNNGSGGFAEVELYAEVFIIDATHHNESVVASTYAFLVDQSFYTNSGAFSLTQGWTSSYLYAYGTFTGGHVYQAELYLGAYVFTDTYGGGDSASASLNLGGTNGVVISSISAY